MSVIVEADGGSRGNPGPAGYGSVVWSADRSTVLAESKQAIGRATNNVAEYRGLIAGLEEAAKLGASDVDVYMDSKLVVEQMSGRWRVKHPDLAPLHQQATALSTRFDRIAYTWIPRLKNSHADRLANEAMDAAAELETPAEEPKAQQPSSPPGWTGARGAPTRFLLLRHGQTELSTQRRYSGRGNPALTDVGRRQAEAAAQYLAQKGGIAAVITSPLQRAYDTAEAAAKALGLDVTVDDDLIETDFGAWEGLTFGEAAERDPELHRRWLRDTTVIPPGGESFDSVAQRVHRAQSRIVAEYGGETVLVVSHVTPIKTLLRIALDANESILYRLHLDL
ncbi:MAG TPA: bifunctional RNase H/acid phosphatase, partial [Mycobacterium sp.]|nr:bifunctional RNase H/acid phosphatase [Mycobacterium sp.]